MFCKVRWPAALSCAIDMTRQEKCGNCTVSNIPTGGNENILNSGNELVEGIGENLSKFTG